MSDELVCHLSCGAGWVCENHPERERSLAMTNQSPEQLRISTFPETIYLQDGDDEAEPYSAQVDYEKTWCVDRIEKADVKYIRADLAAKAEEQIATLTAKLGKAELDAGRYRWLRHGNNDELVMMSTRKRNIPTHVFVLRNEKLDATIDAAIAKEPIK